MTLEITDENFELQVLNNAKPTVLDFWAPGCGPCKSISPHIDALAAEYQERVSVGKVDIQANAAVAMKYGVRNIPTVLYLKDGEVVNKHVGATTKSVLEDLLRRNLL